MDGFICALVVLAAVVVYLGWRQGPEHDLTGKVVLLTGAGGGLGRLLAVNLAERGCRVACVDLATKPNEETASMVHARGRQHGAQPLAKAYTADLTKREAISALVEDVIKDFGQIDILVNNAGQLQGGAIWDLSDAQMDLVLDVNLRACMLLVKDVMPHMKARRSGHIVTISSIAALAPTLNTSAYAATKAGVSQFMECLYYDLQSQGLHENIHVTTVQPYFMNTFSQLEDAVKYNGPLGKLLFSFMDAKVSARTITKCIATRQHVANLPAHLGFTASLLRLFPRAAMGFVIESLAKPDMKIFDYSATRHGRQLAEK
ncbi:uncharacterized oxidoreductase SAR2567-like [Thrips palmi]|uniref:Uncharacterized oxidoreductase SAR2567-like n=1 Tax=Thrips palmi TaxID=161013 RepID=A0A6P8Y6G6_THRPL|nr:uncharacterized oxidoreductase SAR2567-like [Thrips palmi]